MKKFLPLLVLAGFVAVTWMISQTTPSSQRRDQPPQPAVSVQTLTVVAQPYQIKISSFGTVRPRTQSQLVSQVSGQIIAISPNLREGGFFARGEKLITIDPRDYDIAVETARAELASAESVLIEEQARAKQARTEWADARTGSAPSDFALRLPQVAAAEAGLASARARLRQARLNRERTEIVAPYSGRVLSKAVDVGQVVSQNTNLAEVYATDFVEVPLPLKNSELSYIDLPQINRLQQPGGKQPRVTFRSNLGDGNSSWRGKLVRTAGAIDADSNQLHVIAQIDDPYGVAVADQLPLKIGQYVTAVIDGNRLADAIVIPNAAVYQGSYVYVVVERDDYTVLERRDISIAWQNSTEALVGAGIAAGDQLVLTPLGQLSSGTRVSRVDRLPARQAPPLQHTADAGESGEPSP